MSPTDDRPTSSVEQRFGQAVQARREARKLSQSQLSSLTGVPARMIADIERGVRERTRLREIVLIASGLDVDPSDLLREVLPSPYQDDPANDERNPGDDSDDLAPGRQGQSSAEAGRRGENSEGASEPDVCQTPNGTVHLLLRRLRERRDALEAALLGRSLRIQVAVLSPESNTTVYRIVLTSTGHVALLTSTSLRREAFTPHVVLAGHASELRSVLVERPIEHALEDGLIITSVELPVIMRLKALVATELARLHP